MHRLMENYRRACESRLRLWVSPEVRVIRSSVKCLEVEFASHRLTLTFNPASCEWMLESKTETFESANFDRLLKRLRQLMTDFAR